MTTDKADDVTQEVRDVAAEFLETLGFPQFVPMVSGKSIFKDANGERALAVLAHRLSTHPAPDDGLRDRILDIIDEHLEAEYIGHYIAGREKCADAIFAILSTPKQEADSEG